MSIYMDRYVYRYVCVCVGARLPVPFMLLFTHSSCYGADAASPFPFSSQSVTAFERFSFSSFDCLESSALRLCIRC